MPLHRTSSGFHKTPHPDVVGNTKSSGSASEARPLVLRVRARHHHYRPASCPKCNGCGDRTVVVRAIQVLIKTAALERLGLSYEDQQKCNARGMKYWEIDSTRTREGTEISDYAGCLAEDSAMSFRMLRGNPLNPLHFPPNFLKMALVSQNALRQTARPVPPDVVYAFVLSLGRVYHSRVKALHNFRFGEKRNPRFFHSFFYGRIIFCCKTAQLYDPHCKLHSSGSPMENTHCNALKTCATR